jgi:hypothetical protein
VCSNRLTHTEGVQAAEVGRNFSGVCEPDQKRGPKLRALSSGYRVGHHPTLIPFRRVLSVRGLAVCPSERKKRDVKNKAAD